MIWEEETRGNYLLEHNRLVNQAVQRPLVTVNRTWSYNSTLSGLSTKSWPDLQMSISSAVEQVGHKLPSNLWLQLKLEGKGA